MSVVSIRCIVLSLHSSMRWRVFESADRDVIPEGPNSSSIRRMLRQQFARFQAPPSFRRSILRLLFARRSSYTPGRRYCPPHRSSAPPPLRGSSPRPLRSARDGGDGGQATREERGAARDRRCFLLGVQRVRKSMAVLNALSTAAW